jgi:hypothetical protein
MAISPTTQAICGFGRDRFGLTLDKLLGQQVRKVFQDIVDTLAQGSVGILDTVVIVAQVGIVEQAAGVVIPDLVA